MITNDLHVRVQDTSHGSIMVITFSIPQVLLMIVAHYIIKYYCFIECPTHY